MPLMADIMCGIHAPIASGFAMAQWRTIQIDKLFGNHHDIANANVQLQLHEQLQKADFLWAAFDCSTKTRCR